MPKVKYEGLQPAKPSSATMAGSSTGASIMNPSIITAPFDSV
jgi:hypothetical protein